MTNIAIGDVEVIERQYPVIIHQFSRRYGSGGKGRFRGGDGCVRDIEFTRKVNVAILSQRRSVAPYGMCGGSLRRVIREAAGSTPAGTTSLETGSAWNSGLFGPGRRASYAFARRSWFMGLLTLIRLCLERRARWDDWHVITFEAIRSQLADRRVAPSRICLSANIPSSARCRLTPGLQCGDARKVLDAFTETTRTNQSPSISVFLTAKLPATPRLTTHRGPSTLSSR
jgi:hypothetical protein